MSPTTAFGSDLASPERAAAVLRARAARLGVPLTRPAAADLAAAVVGAEAWLAATRAPSLDSAPGVSAAQRRVLARILMRAAGCGETAAEPPAAPAGDPELEERLDRRLARVRAQVARWPGVEGQRVFAVAAGDLDVQGAGRELAAAAWGLWNRAVEEGQAPSGGADGVV